MALVLKEFCMPRCCHYCMFNIMGSHCELLDTDSEDCKFDYDTWDIKRKDNCPLIEVPYEKIKCHIKK